MTKPERFVARGPVRVLAQDLANQIAAGEVVERPASAVKELVENALDAGATRIHVDVEAGGTALIRVADDGIGMTAEDAALAVLRHATSKLERHDDLAHIRSFGFRGEALPSIASVSRFSLRSRRSGDPAGTEVMIDGGGKTKTKPCGMAPGTVVELRDLFYNVPARRKFLRSVGAESASVTEVVEAAALGEPAVGFVLVRDGKKVKDFPPAASREERARVVFAGEPLVRCEGTRGPVEVEAFLSPPERGRAGSQHLLLFVNGRPVRDRQLARNVAHAYGSVLEKGRFPVGVVFVDVPPERVDVNVHPQKSEVRFADGRVVPDAVHSILGRALQRAFGLEGNLAKDKLFDTPRAGDAPREAWIWEGAPSPSDQTPRAGGVRLGEMGSVPDAPRMLRTLPSAELLEAHEEVPLDTERSRPETPFRALRFVGQVKATYLLCEGDDGVYVLDQHAAAERVTFHRLRTGYAARTVETQRLLFPAVLPATADEVARVEDWGERILGMGLDLRPAGTTQVAVHAVPALLKRASPERLARDLLDETSAGERAFTRAIELALATMACHGSLRAGEMISAEEAKALLMALDDVDFAGHCPHGRPIVTRLTYRELDIKVGRR